jgi:hypothetical protein
MTKSNLQIQGNFHKNFYVIFHRNSEINPKIHMETQKASNNQSSPEQKEKCLEDLTSNYSAEP